MCWPLAATYRAAVTTDSERHIAWPSTALSTVAGDTPLSACCRWIPGTLAMVGAMMLRGSAARAAESRLARTDIGGVVESGRERPNPPATPVGAETVLVLGSCHSSSNGHANKRDRRPVAAHVSSSSEDRRGGQQVVLLSRRDNLPVVAGLAQLVEHLICNHEVASSILAPGSSNNTRSEGILLFDTMCKPAPCPQNAHRIPRNGYDVGMRGSVRKPRTRGGTWSYRIDLGSTIAVSDGNARPVDSRQRRKPRRRSTTRRPVCNAAPSSRRRAPRSANFSTRGSTGSSPKSP